MTRMGEVPYGVAQLVGALAQELEVSGSSPVVTRCPWLVGGCMHMEFTQCPCTRERLGFFVVEKEKK